MIDANSVPPMPDTDEPLFDGDPIPLTQPMVLPPFPVDMLPAQVAAMVRTVAEATQTDPAMAGTCVLSVLSACTGGHAVIEIRGGWIEPLHTYHATIAASGERKSAVQKLLVTPVLDVEQDLVVKGVAERLEAETRKHVADSAAEKAKRAAANAANTDNWDSAMADAIGAAQIAASIDIPVPPRLVVDDITPEAAGTMLAEQGGRMAVISAEGGIFDIIAGRYSGNIPNLDLWLKGHSGDPFKVDRKGRDPEYVRRPAVTLGLMIQPSVLSAVAANRQFRGRGLLARILYAYPTSKVGRRAIAPASPDEEVVQVYEEHVRTLAAGLAKWAGDPAVLTLTPTAHEAMVTIETAVEPTLAGGGELATLADWGSKYCGAVARIAGMLHLSTLGPDAGPRAAVTAQTILAAHRIGEYFKACAINAFTEMGADPVVADAVYLWGRIKHLGQVVVSERDLHRACPTRFQKKETLLATIDRLVDNGYLAPIPVPQQRTKGRPASPTYQVHGSAKH
jgi:hypothetical protein